MKKVIVLLVIVLCMVSFVTKAQLPTEISQPFFPNNYPSLAEIKAKLGDYSEKGHKVFLALVEIANYELADTTFRFSDAEQLSLDKIFSFIVPTPEVVTLHEKEWLNLFYSESKSKVDWKFGDQFTGPVWMLKIGSYKFPFMLAKCGNAVYRVSQYTPKGFSSVDMYDFKRKLNNISNQLNLVSKKTDDNKSDNDSLKAEIAKMRLEMNGYKTATDKKVAMIENDNQIAMLSVQRETAIRKGNTWLFAGIASDLLGGGALIIANTKKSVEQTKITESQLPYNRDVYELLVEEEDGTFSRVAKCGSETKPPQPPCPPVIPNVTNITIEEYNTFISEFNTYISNTYQYNYEVNNYYLTEVNNFITNNTFVTNNYLKKYKLGHSVQVDYIKFIDEDQITVRVDRDKKAWRTAGYSMIAFGLLCNIPAILNYTEAHHFKVKIDGLNNMAGVGGPKSTPTLGIIKTIGANYHGIASR